MKWLKHDSDSHTDAKIQKVIRNYGLEGLGLYWHCLELIAKNINKNNITFELEHDAIDIAYSVRSTEQKVSEMMRYFVSIGLFEESAGKITCLKIAKRLDSSMTSNPEMRQIIAKIKAKTANNHDMVMTNHDMVMTNHDGVMTESEKPMQDKTRLEEIRLEESNNSCPPSDDPPPKKSKPKIPEKYAADVEIVLNHWHKVIHDESPRIQLCDSKRLKILARLKKDCSVDDLIKCVDGCASDNWTKKNNSSPDYLFRNRDNVEKFFTKSLGLTNEKPSRRNETAEQHEARLIRELGLGNEIEGEFKNV